MTVVRELPPAGVLHLVGGISVSDAESLLSCSLRAAFNNDSMLRRMRPVVASALLGTAAHNALASMANAARPENRAANTPKSTTRQVAQEAFDAALCALCDERDAQIADRGPLPGESNERPTELPFYAVTRARLVRFARKRLGDDWLWKWPRPLMHGVNPHPLLSSTSSIAEGPHTEVSLHSSDGRLRGIADSIIVAADNVTIEEFKTGELTHDRVPGWTLQLMLYGYLFEQTYGIRPKTLRVHSIGGATHDIAYDHRVAEAEAERVRCALSTLNEAIGGGALAQDLAAPAQTTCLHCSHRAWCEAYWTSPVPGLVGTDLDGVVAKIDGWKVFLLRSDGSTIVVDFRWYGCLPLQGQRLRLCDARIGRDQTVLADRSTSVWSLR